MTLTQLEIPGLEITPKVDATDFFSESSAESRGEIFTREEVVDFILDLTKWDSDSNLEDCRLLEPSCGTGEFLIPAIIRFLDSKDDVSAKEIAHNFLGVEVNKQALQKCRQRVANLLIEYKFSKKDAKWLSHQWVRHGDFLTMSLDADFTHIVGNPPYLRQEALPDELLKLYRAKYSTMYDRADLYVPFFEKSLSLLVDGGSHGFICSDRWMKNKYGGPLRDMVSNEFHLDAYIDFTGTDAFHDEVVAYPAVTIIRRGKGTRTHSAIRPKVSKSILAGLSKSILAKRSTTKVIAVENVASGAEPWLLENLPLVAELRKLEKKLPKVEEAGCKVGIGVATGADKIYIKRDSDLDVEEELKLPILTTRDVKDGKVQWDDRYVLNPFQGNTSKLVDPDDYPKLKAYLSKHEEGIRKRHVSKKSPNAWFKTIDRIYPELTAVPKLLIPDIKGEAEVILDKGEFYPHHNFYYITTSQWDLHALQAVMLSPIAKAFVSTYSLKMRGDCLRFQAQYLRRIRLPEWDSIELKVRKELTKAAKKEDYVKCNELVRQVYGISQKAWKIFAAV